MRRGSIKNTRINAEVRKETQNVVINGIRGPRISAITTVVDVRVTADSRYCTVYVNMLDSEQEATDMLAGLRDATGFIRSELARSVNLRITPELKSALDKPMAYGTHINKMLEDLHLSEQAETKED